MGGSDCELLRDGWLAQPANAWSSAAFLVAGAYVLLQRRRAPREARARLLAGAVALALVAVGSAAFHGPQPSWADVAHDGSITALLVVLLVRGSGGGGRRAVAAGVGVLAVALAVLAARADAEAVVHVPLVAATAVLELRRLRAGESVGSSAVVAAAALGGGVVLLVLGRTGGPLCAPASWAQAHAGWHVLGAVAAGALAAADPRRRVRPAPTGS